MALEIVPRETTNGHVPALEPPAPAGAMLMHVRVDMVDVGENVRIQPGELDELTASIAEHGVLQPVRAIGPHVDGRYRLVWGQRRLLAARLAGLERIPAIVEASADVDQPGPGRAIEQLVENLQRADLNPINEAKALRQVLDAQDGLTQAELAKNLGRSAPWVANSLRLLELTEPVQQLVIEGKLTASHGKAIASLPPKHQQDLARQAVDYHYSAHELERQAQWRQKSAKAEDPDYKKKRTERFAKKVIKVLEADAVPKDAKVSVSQWEVDDKQLKRLLREAGYGSTDHVGSYGYEPEKIGCDCNAYRWDTYPKPHFKRICVSREHIEAFQAKEHSAEAQRKKELRNKAVRLAGVLELGMHGLDPTAARLIVCAIAGRSLHRILDTNGDPWPKLEAIADGDMPGELAELVATTLLNERDYDQIESAGLARTINRLAAAPAKKGKRAEVEPAGVSA
jgi:ParB family chromosome partitioning protein